MLCDFCYAWSISVEMQNLFYKGALARTAAKENFTQRQDKKVNNKPIQMILSLCFKMILMDKIIQCKVTL